jgi:hypothetical protein
MIREGEDNMTDTSTVTHTRSWIFYATLLVLFWGIWGAFSALPATRYGYPDEMIYSDEKRGEAPTAAVLEPSTARNAT